MALRTFQSDMDRGTSLAPAIETALRIAGARRKILEELREAVIRNDAVEIRRLAARLCGVDVR